MHQPSTTTESVASGRTGLSASIGVSIVLHLSLLGTFAAVGGFDAIKATDASREVSWSNAGEDFEPASLVTEPMIGAANPDLPPAPDNIDIAIDPVGPPVVIPTGGGRGDNVPVRTVASSDLARSLKPAGRGKKGTGTGTGEGTGAGRGPRAGFFGRPVTGDRVVFVVDCSGSMNHPHPGPTKNRINRVKLELIEAVKALAENQSFYIVFFNDRAFPMPADRLVPADDANKLKYLQWMVNVMPGGHTDPSEALVIALNLRPDTIYFLTDGIFRPAIVSQVAISNGNRVKINTIGFAEDGGEPLMKAIAEQNSGTYLFIPPDEGMNVDPAVTASLSGPAPQRP